MEKLHVELYMYKQFTWVQMQRRKVIKGLPLIGEI